MIDDSQFSQHKTQANRGAGEDIQTLGGDLLGGASGDEDEETDEEEHDPWG